MIDIIFFICSIVSFAIPVLLVLSIRYLLKGSVYYSLANECACTVLWLCWSFEKFALSRHTNDVISLAVFFIAMCIQPYVYSGALANTCGVAFQYLLDNMTLRKVLLVFMVELLAIPLSMILINVNWRSLSILSPLHSDVYLHQNILSLGLMGGFVCEVFVSFMAHLPGRFIAPGPTCDVISAMNFTILEIIFARFTGACFNPLPVTAFSLYFNRHSWVELGVVYWMGGVTGTLLAWKLLFQSKLKHKHS
jgi:hypothetical protein